jgi:hypothetical protein
MSIYLGLEICGSYIEGVSVALVVGDVVVPLLEVVSHAGEGGVDQTEPGDVNVVVLVRTQV